MPKETIVIGGGIVGVSTAIWLRRMGAEVTLIDRLGYGKGTSHGNAGILAACAMVPVTGPGLIRKAPGMVLNPDFPLFMRWSYLPKLVPWLVKYLSFANAKDTYRIAEGIASVVTDSVDQHLSLAKGTRAEDWITLSHYSYAYRDRAAFDGDKFSWDIRAQNGFTPTLHEGAVVHDMEPNLAAHIGLLATMQDHGYIRDPGGYVAALGTEFEELGGKTVLADVKDIELTDGKVTAVLTTQGRHPCNTLALATGVWSKPLMQKLGLNIPLESERGYHILFKDAQNGPSHPIMIADGKFVATPMKDGVRCAGVVEFGGLEAGPSKAPLAFLRKHTRAAFPNMTWSEEIEWQGHRPATTDSLPLIGEIRNTGIFAGFGHQHIGLTAGPKTGRLLAQLITDQQPNLDLTPYAPTRFA